MRRRIRSGAKIASKRKRTPARRYKPIKYIAAKKKLSGRSDAFFRVLVSGQLIKYRGAIHSTVDEKLQAVQERNTSTSVKPPEIPASVKAAARAIHYLATEIVPQVVSAIGEIGGPASSLDEDALLEYIKKYIQEHPLLPTVAKGFQWLTDGSEVRYQEAVDRAESWEAVKSQLESDVASVLSQNLTLSEEYAAQLAHKLVDWIVGKNAERLFRLFVVTVFALDVAEDQGPRDVDHLSATGEYPSQRTAPARDTTETERLLGRLNYDHLHSNQDAPGINEVLDWVEEYEQTELSIPLLVPNDDDKEEKETDGSILLRVRVEAGFRSRRTEDTQRSAETPTDTP